MDRFDIQQSICHAIDAQMAEKWQVSPSQAHAADTYSLDLQALLRSLEYEFQIRLDLEQALYRIGSINELSLVILEKTRANACRPA
ncbi:acyl carrier protein [Pseudomonas sp. NFXW11]|uniref:acyl carrier protein n=1 Tax=Pseudomonas sp. NFXW11 TaxID=2819531 RepID=UPI003CEDD835